MFENIHAYLDCQGQQYIKPEKAGDLAGLMLDLRSLGQAARREFQEISQELGARVLPFEAERVSQWMNQAQVCRPHFWCYYRLPSDSVEDVALAIRLYGQKEKFGLSLEVSFVERKRSEQTLQKQAGVLDLPIVEPLYYWVQVDGLSHRVDGTEENRNFLQTQLAKGQVRKVLVKYDLALYRDMGQTELLDGLVEGFQALLPYYEACK